jgi:hypothetical protein
MFEGEGRRRMLRKQILIVLGVLAAVAACLAGWRLGLGHGPAADPGVAARLALAWRWMLVPALTLLVGLGFTANRRFLSDSHIDGGGAPAGSAFDINLRYNLNTLEQTVLAAVAWSGLSLTPSSREPQPDPDPGRAVRRRAHRVLDRLPAGALGAGLRAGAHLLPDRRRAGLADDYFPPLMGRDRPRSGQGGGVWLIPDLSLLAHTAPPCRACRAPVPPH